MRQLIGATLFVTLALTGVVWLLQSLRFVDLIINRGLSALTFLHLTLLLLPTVLAYILPLALFCGVVYTYHRLSIDSEIVVMRATVLSQAALARPALILAAATTVVCYAITLYFMPLGFRTFKDRQFTIRSDYSHVLLKEGTFNVLPDGLTVYLRARRANGELVGILVHSNRDPDVPVTMMAERAALISTPRGPRLLLINGNRQEMQRKTNKLSLLYFDRYNIDLSSITNVDQQRWREPRERYMHELFRPPRTPDDESHRGELLAEGHQRLVAPLFCIGFALIGLAGLLSGEFNRRGQMPRMLMAAAAAVAFQVLSLTLANVIIKTPVLTPLLYLNAVLAVLAAGYFLLRERSPRAAPRMRVAPDAG